MADMNKLSQFWRGRPVIEKSPCTWDDNPGHVIGFAKSDDPESEVFVRVEFANGDRYNLSPDDLNVL